MLGCLDHDVNIKLQVLIEELQDTVQNLTKENSSIRKELEELRLRSEDLMRENLQLRVQQRLSQNYSSASSSLPLTTASHNSATLPITSNTASLSMTSNAFPLSLSVPSHRPTLWRVPDGMNANVRVSMPSSLDQFISLRGGLNSLIQHTSERNATSHDDLTAEYLRSLYEGKSPE
jgi:FtsZ-binding cell division protein ZapB